MNDESAIRGNERESSPRTERVRRRVTEEKVREQGAERSRRINESGDSGGLPGMAYTGGLSGRRARERRGIKGGERPRGGPKTKNGGINP